MEDKNQPPVADFSAIEGKWQKEWEKANIFEAKDDSEKKKIYVLEMFPYPSGAGLHMGHALNYTIGDIYARFKRMNGFNVLYPMGYDAFGLPAENAAIKAGEHPKSYTSKSIASFIRQQKRLGLSYDWSRLITTCEPDYYRWNQYFFLKFYENGLVYRKKSAVNWCPKCSTVLANEQVHSGKCWRHTDTDAEMKQLEQWFIKTTKYSEELLEKSEKLEWPEKIKTLQKNWIGKSHGTEINFEISNPDDDLSKKEFVFLHAYKDDSKQVFWPWLRKEIESRGGKVVFAPNLPNTSSPNYKEQSEFVLKNYKFNENTVVIAHSLGNVLMMKLLSEKSLKINKLIMVAPPLSKTASELESGAAFLDRKPRPALASYCDWKFDFKKIASSVGKIIVLADEKDHIVPISQPKEIASSLGANFIAVTGSSTHFGGVQEPAVLNQIVSCWPIFTTRPDTIYGVTFLVVSAQHSRLFDLVTKEQKAAVEGFLKKLKSVSEKELELMDKEGVFTGAYATNPMTGEKVPVWAGNFVVADYGCGMVMAVPAHDQRDYEFAAKYKIPIKQVVAPSFVTSTGPDAVRKDKPTVERESVFGIVKHWKEDKYFMLDWTKFGWKSFVIGGVEKKEAPEEAVAREVREETGYQDIKSVKRVSFDTFATFFARHKDENRRAKYVTFLVELGSDKHSEPEKEHVQNHKGLWLNRKEVAGFLNLENNVYLWNCYLKGEMAFTGEGVLINSGPFSGIESVKAIEEITKHLEKKKLGSRTVNYKLRDWLISRQRYWGTPIPMVYCAKCGVVPVPERELPVVLPDDVAFGEGNPLASNKKFVETECPKCGGKARRETDTMDTFFDSSWYYLRYCDSKNSAQPYDQKKVKQWMPVDQYIGGAEHACMHLIYARFFTKVLRDMELLSFDEPFTRLFNQGMLHGADGNKMSKSLGNTVDPIENVDKFCADSLRFNLMSLSAPDSDSVWSDRGMESAHRFVVKMFGFFSSARFGKSSKVVQSKTNKAIKLVTADIESFRYNYAIITLRDLFGSMSSQEALAKEDAESFIKMLHPVCPHITEELWRAFGNKGFLSLEGWPVADESKIDEQLERIESVVSNLRLDIFRIRELAKLEKISKVRVFVAPEWKWKALGIVKKACSGRPDFGAAMKALSAEASLKKYSSEIPAFAKGAVSRLGELSNLEEFDEAAVISEVKPVLEREFGSIEVIRAEDSKEAKAKNAFPGKPALLVE